MAKSFKELTEREILALAITLEEEDARMYADLAESLQANYPGTAELFRGMMKEETEHRRKLTEVYRERFGDHIPMIRPEDVKGFVKRQPVWLTKNLGLDRIRKTAAAMEFQTRRFYEQSAARTSDARVRQLLTDLAEEERHHEATAEQLTEEHVGKQVIAQEDEAKRRLFIMQIIQPGLAGLMDGSVSTLAPIFAAAITAHNASPGHPDLTAFKVGLAASIGAGISMAFAEALSDDGSLTGRGRPLIRGIACGLMTTAGGIGHTLPFLIPNFQIAFWSAILVVALELAAISWIRHRFMESPWISAAIQVVIGGIVVLLAGIFIGAG
ncbi:MAG TPA: ferritin family protein [Phycisphaerae bacterium]|nr:ferritin family protein [Phycisphaerae bacterium]